MEESGMKTEPILYGLNPAEDSRSTQEMNEDQRPAERGPTEMFGDESPDTSGSDEKAERAVGEEDTAGGVGHGMDVKEQERRARPEEEERRRSESAEILTLEETADQTRDSGEVGQEVQGHLLEQEEGREIRLLVRHTISGEGSSTFMEQGAVTDGGGLRLSPTASNGKGDRVDVAQESDLSMSYEACERERQTLQAESNHLRQLNEQMQARLAEYFLRSPAEEVQPGGSSEDRYHVLTSLTEELQLQRRLHSARSGRLEAELQQQVQERLSQAEREWRDLQALKRHMTLAVLGRRMGRQGAQAQVEQIQATEWHKESELVRVRLENVQLKATIAKGEVALAANKGPAEGLHLLDFEQLKLENQTYGEKIEERDQEIRKLREKMAAAVQVLTHVREKLQAVQAENRARREQLAELETEVAGARDSLTRAKQARDGLRTHNLRLRQQGGLLGNRALLLDLEERIDGAAALELRLGALKSGHCEARRRGGQAWGTP